MTAARAFTAVTLTGWGAQDYEFAAETVVSELCGNAALHARTDFTVALMLNRSGLRVEVSDHSVAMPRRLRYSLEATTGRGLTLVDAVCEEWGVMPREDGKTVWAYIAASSVGDREPSMEMASESADGAVERHPADPRTDAWAKAA